MFWWRYIDFIFARKVIWFLFVILKRSFERRNKTSRSYFKFNVRKIKQKLKILKRRRFRYTVDEYLSILKRLKWKHKQFSFFRRIFSVYFRMNFKRL